MSAETEHHGDADPESWSRLRSHKARKHGLPGVQGIPTTFDVVEHLAQNGDRRNPHETATILCRDRRTEKPLAATNLNAAHHDAGTDEASQIADAQRPGFRQFGNFPSGEACFRQLRRDWFSHAAPSLVQGRRGSLGF